MKHTVLHLAFGLYCSLAAMLVVSAGELEDALLSESLLSNPAKIHELVEKGANVNARDQDGASLLINISDIRTKHTPEMVQYLIKKGADVNAYDKKGQTALINAATYGNTAVVEILVEKGADVNAKNNNGVRALTYAAMYGHTDVVRLLIKKGADVNAKDDMGLTALTMARFMKNQKDTSEGHKKALNDIIGILEQAGAR